MINGQILNIKAYFIDVWYYFIAWNAYGKMDSIIIL